MDQPLVSVIIPAYNSRDWIGETIQSALAQTYSHVEVLVIDDASSDDTWEMLQPFKNSARLFRNERNSGISVSRNRGIQESKGDFVALLDHDDLWAPDKLAKQMRLFNANPSLGIVFSDCFCINREGKKWRYFQERLPERGHVLHRLIQDNFIPCPTALISKRVLDTVGSFSEAFRCGEEYELFLRIARHFPLDYVNEPLATYRIHARNFSGSGIHNNMERIVILNLYSKDVPLKGEIAVRHMILSVLLIKQRQIKQGLAQLTRGINQTLRRPVQAINAFLTIFKQKRHRAHLIAQ